jgi:hypothetical protein
MARDSLRGFLQLGFFITFAGFCGALYAPSDSGEFVVSVCSSAIGLTLIVGSIAVWRLLR